MLAIKKYIYKTKGFTIKTKTKTIQNKLSNGKLITKVVHYDCLTDVSPNAIVNGKLVLPDVDSINYNAFEHIRDCELSTIILPKNLKEMGREHHVSPLFYLKHWANVEMPEVGNSNFFTEDGKLYEIEPVSGNKNSSLPTSVELMYANPYSAYAPQAKASVVNLTNPTAVTLNNEQVASRLTSVTSLKINPGAFKHSNLNSVNILLQPKTNLYVNSIKTANLNSFGIPDELVVNGSKITQSQFLTHGARILVGVLVNDKELLVQHIDGSNDVDKFWNADEITEPLNSWNAKIEQERQTVAMFNAKKSRSK